MPRLVVPLLGRKLQSTGDLILRAELDLLLRGRDGVARRATFRVDSGADMSTMPAAIARGLELNFPRDPVRGLLYSGSPEVRNGLLHAQVVGMGRIVFLFPCFFLGEPDVLDEPTSRPILIRNLLGLTGVVDKLRFLFDGEPTPDAPHGTMVVETR